MTIEQVKKLKAMVVEVELIKNEEAFSEKDIKEIAEGQEKIIKKQDELIDYMLSLLWINYKWYDRDIRIRGPYNSILDSMDIINSSKHIWILLFR